jgi:hypothetical protein
MVIDYDRDENTDPFAIEEWDHSEEGDECDYTEEAK